MKPNPPNMQKPFREVKGLLKAVAKNESLNEDERKAVKRALELLSFAGVTMDLMMTQQWHEARNMLWRGLEFGEGKLKPI